MHSTSSSALGLSLVRLVGWHAGRCRCLLSEHVIGVGGGGGSRKKTKQRGGYTYRGDGSRENGRHSPRQQCPSSRDSPPPIRCPSVLLVWRSPSDTPNGGFPGPTEFQTVRGLCSQKQSVKGGRKTVKSGDKMWGQIQRSGGQTTTCEAGRSRGPKAPVQSRDRKNTFHSLQSRHVPPWSGLTLGFRDRNISE